MRSKAKRRLYWINILIMVSVLLLILGLASIAIKPEGTVYLAWSFTVSCFILAFLMIRNNILKRLKR